jgi:hypothetical protein
MSRLQREFQIVGEYARLIRRAPAKFTRQMVRDYSLRLSGLAPGWQVANLACRIIDDVCDGERDLPAEFVSVPEMMVCTRDVVRGESINANSLMLTLLADAVQTIEVRERIPGETRVSFLGLLDAMQVEYDRRIQRTLLPQSQLIAIHIASSLHALNLSLIGLGSANRAGECPALAEFIGRMGALRDLEHELRLGIINLPREVLPEDVNLDDVIAHPERILTQPAVVAWKQAEAREGLRLAEQLRSYSLDPWATRVTKNQVALYLQYATSMTA